MLRPEQTVTLYELGSSIAFEWVRAYGDKKPDPDYDFSGDWEAVRDTCIEEGIPWDPDSTQPDTPEVWDWVERGYRDYLEEHYE